MKRNKVYGVGVYEKGDFDNILGQVLGHCVRVNAFNGDFSSKCNSLEKINYAKKIMNELNIAGLIQLVIINKI